MFLGTFDIDVDKVSRIIIPKRIFNESNDNSFAVTVIDKDYYVFFPKKDWKPENLLIGYNINPEKIQTYINYILAHTYIFTLDSQRRVNLSIVGKPSFTHGVVIGRGSYFILVNKELFLDKSGTNEFSEFLKTDEGKDYKKKLLGNS